MDTTEKRTPYLGRRGLRDGSVTLDKLSDEVKEALSGSGVKSVTATVDNGTGVPSVDYSFEDGDLTLGFKNLKGATGSDGSVGPAGPAGPAGPPGPQGETCAYDPNNPDTPVFQLATTSGQSQTKAMTQKATTEMLDCEETYEGWAFKRLKYIDTSNGAMQNSNYCHTDYIPLDSLSDSDTLKLSNLVTGSSYKGGYYYDEEKNFISSPVIAATNVEINKADMPTNAAYVRLNFAINTYPVIKFIHRGQRRIQNLEDRLQNFDRKKLTVNTFNNNTYIKSADGTSTTLSGLKTTGYIPLNGAKSVHSSQGNLVAIRAEYGEITSSTCTIAFYDENKAFIPNTAAHNRFAICPPNAAYIRCTIPSSATETVITLYNIDQSTTAITIQLDSVATQLDNTISPGLKGKTVAFIGDSITQANGNSNPYHKVFADLAGCTNINLGVNATTIAANPTNNMGSDRFITRATSENLTNVDMVVIFGGTNDFSYDRKPIGDLFVEETISPSNRIGNKRLIAPTDNETFAGALHELILQVRSIIGEKPIVLMTPLNRGRYSEGRPISSECNANGDYLFDFVNAIKEIGRFYAIPVFDAGGVMNFDPTERSSSSMSADLLHPNTAGHARLGKLLYKWVCQNIVI